MGRRNSAQPRRSDRDEGRPEREPTAPARERDWADEAAQARTADDPRAVAPHDAVGEPSTGDRR
jgi:hypothetical protein